jgi:hypothetical protein
LQLLHERGNSGFRLHIITSYTGEHANAPHPLRLLRARQAATSPPRREA